MKQGVAYILILCVVLCIIFIVIQPIRDSKRTDFAGIVLHQSNLGRVIDHIERLTKLGLKHDYPNPQYGKLINRVMFKNHYVRKIAVKSHFFKCIKLF